MFPPAQTRLRSALRRSVDAAIEFATLGEYGFASAWEDQAGSAGGSAADAPPAPTNSTAPRATTFVEPASAAGRARRDAQRREAPRCCGQPLRGRVRDPQLPRVARSRDGMAPRELRCLTAEPPAG